MRAQADELDRVLATLGGRLFKTPVDKPVAGVGAWMALTVYPYSIMCTSPKYCSVDIQLSLSLPLKLEGLVLKMDKVCGNGGCIVCKSDGFQCHGVALHKQASTHQPASTGKFKVWLVDLADKATVCACNSFIESQVAGHFSLLRRTDVGWLWRVGDAAHTDACDLIAPGMPDQSDADTMLFRFNMHSNSADKSRGSLALTSISLSLAAAADAQTRLKVRQMAVADRLNEEDINALFPPLPNNDVCVVSDVGMRGGVYVSRVTGKSGSAVAYDQSLMGHGDWFTLWHKKRKPGPMLLDAREKFLADVSVGFESAGVAFLAVACAPGGGYTVSPAASGLGVCRLLEWPVEEVVEEVVEVVEQFVPVARVTKPRTHKNRRPSDPPWFNLRACFPPL